MKSPFEEIYLRSPVVVQNAAVTLFGLIIKQIRKSGKYRNYLHEVILRNSLEPNMLNNYIIKCLKSALKDAANTPYYRILFDKIGFSPDDVKSEGDLVRLPILEKEIVRSNQEQFINDKYKRSRILTLHTTGTTGTPITIFCSKDVRRKNFAFFDNYLLSVGINPRGKRATFWGRIVVSPEECNPPFWRYSVFQKNLLFSSYHLNNKNIPIYLKKLYSYRPHYIDAYPSSIYILAKYALDNGINMKGVTKAITTSAETLYPWQREVIQAVFDIPVYDQYGSAEMCVFVGQCREGNYHIRTDYSLLEFIRDDGHIAQPGEEAELVCTTFINPVMPLIRYRIGDRGIRSDEPCRCGSPYPVMKTLVGRSDDVINTPDGRKVGRLGSVLKGFPVKEGQYVQKNLHEIIVRLVKADGYSNETESQITKELHKRLGFSITIKYQYLDEITRGPGGKFKTIISLINEKGV